MLFLSFFKFHDKYEQERGFFNKRPGWPLNPVIVSTHARGCSRQHGAPPASSC